MLPGRKMNFPAGFRPDSIRELSKSVSGRPKTGPETRFPALKHYFVTKHTFPPTPTPTRGSKTGLRAPTQGIVNYRCLQNKRPSKPYGFQGSGVMDVTKPYKFIWFGDILCPKAYRSIGFRWAFISQTPVGSWDSACDLGGGAISPGPPPRPRQPTIS